MATLTATNRQEMIETLQTDPRLKRVAVSIRTKKNFDQAIDGCVLINELNENLFAFFCTTKFLIDEELQINLNISGHELEYRVQLSHLHEQISSGRVMKTLPTEEDPFPARKFYRCFARVMKQEAATETDTNTDATSEASTTLQAVPDMPPEAEAPPTEQAA